MAWNSLIYVNFARRLLQTLVRKDKTITNMGPSRELAALQEPQERMTHFMHC